MSSDVSRYLEHIMHSDAPRGTCSPRVDKSSYPTNDHAKSAYCWTIECGFILASKWTMIFCTLCIKLYNNKEYQI